MGSAPVVPDIRHGSDPLGSAGDLSRVQQCFFYVPQKCVRKHKLCKAHGVHIQHTKKVDDCTSHVRQRTVH